MKKFVLTMLSAACLMTARAQPAWGVKAGANLPNVVGEDVSGAIKNMIGYYVGGYVSIPVKEKLTVQPELIWSNMGYKYNELGRFKTSFNYLHIPVMLKYQAQGFYAETGPQLGILVTARQKIEDEPSESIKDAFKTISLSWGAGAGYGWESGFGVGLRYNLGIGSISSDSHIGARFNVLMIGVYKTFQSK